MRWTTGLLLTLALLLPGAARAQPGFTGPNDPFGPRAGAPGDPGTPYGPGLPPYLNDLLTGQNSPGAPFDPDRYDPLRLQPNPPYRPGAHDPYRNPYSPNPPLVGSPLPQPEGPLLPPGFAGPADAQSAARLKPAMEIPPSVALSAVRRLSAAVWNCQKIT